ncbi:MAG: hypothetical protein RIF37_12530 [Rhodospirillaceae bacterium]
MADSKQQKPPSKSDDAKARSAQALRDNLKRRKMQARAKAEADETTGNIDAALSETD